MDDFFKDLCEEKHKDADRRIEGLEKWLEKLDKKMTWFYVIAISTLIGVIVELAKG